MRVDACGEDTTDRTQTAAGDSELAARGWSVAQRISVSVPAAEAVLGEVSEGPEVFAVEFDSALRLFGVARLQIRPFRGKIGTGGLNPRIEGFFHCGLA